MAVGLSCQYCASTTPGAVYVFEHNGGSWTETKLTASDDGSRNLFSHDIAVKGVRIAVGAPYADSFAGAAYLYERVGGSWTETRLTGTDVAFPWLFGASVGLGARWAVVEARGDNTVAADAGSAYVYSLITDSDGDGLADEVDHDDENEDRPDEPQAVLAVLQSLVGTWGSKKADHFLDKAADRLEESLADGLWNDASTLDLNERQGARHFHEIKKAVSDLEKVVRNGGACAAPALDAIERLVPYTRLIAQTELYTVDCTLGGSKDQRKCEREVGRSEGELERGDDEWLRAQAHGKHYDKPVGSYRKAWDHAVKAGRTAGSDSYEEDDEDEDESEEDGSIVAAQMLTLEGNYPNPFNPRTTIRFQLTERAYVTLTIYDVAGREVLRLIDGEIAPGRHEASFDAGSLASGIYLYRLTTPSATSVRTMHLVK